jgi:hypothetical protein
MKRSAGWAVIRNEARKMPWDDDPTATIFPAIAHRKGTAFALRMWNLLVEFCDIVDREEATSEEVVAFCDRVRARAPEDAGPFVQVLMLCRTVVGGMERRRIARGALRKQLARVRRS